MTDPIDTGRATRRRFLAGAAGLAATGATAARADNAKNLPPNVADWTRQLGEGVGVRAYGNPSKYEKDVIRRTVSWLTATPESSVSFTPLHQLDGIITPNGLCFERHHGGIAEVNPADYRLMLHGLVEKPLIFTLDELKRLPRVNKIYFLECAANSGMEWRGAQLNGCQYTHGMVHCVQYTGVPLKILLEQAGLKPNAKWIMAEGGDAAAMNRSIPMSKALEDCIVAYRMNGEMLRPEQGYPVRLVVPGWEGNVNIKWLRRIKLGDKPWYSREETSKYTDLMPDGTSRGFTWLIDAKSVITFPCPEKPLAGPGLYEIRGLAWTGNGKVKRVDVSTDGGVNWQTAQLHEPVLSKALTKFTLPWQWDGRPTLLQSRVIDESGYVQPTIAELRKQRGTNSVYHNNSIQTWQVKPDGSVFDVQLA